ncbi:MAG: diaminobutyrate--2-oxoglutarate transaminase family protein [Halobacteria archaeon]
MAMGQKHQQSNRGFLERQSEYESNARVYPRNLPIAVNRGEGAYVTDVEGREYIDCLAGAGSLALGHNHPVVEDAVLDGLQRKEPQQCLDMASPTKERFVDTLFGVLPDGFSRDAKIQFCSPAGTDAVEAALKIVTAATGKSTLLGFSGGYHGMSSTAMELMGDSEARRKASVASTDVHQFPFPYSYRCPFCTGGTDVRKGGVSTEHDEPCQGKPCHEVCSNYVENRLDDPYGGIGEPAGMVTEIVQGEGGVIPAPNRWVKEMRRITGERDIPFVVDEIQTGLGRTGEMFAVEHADVTPDVMTLSKAIGGGFPLSVVVYDCSLDVLEPGSHAGTFRGNQYAMAAGAAAIEYIVDNDLAEKADRLGTRLRSHLERTARKHGEIGDVRGKGLMLGVEIVDPDAGGDGVPPHDGDTAERIQRRCLDEGLIVETGGRDSSVVRFLPPLVVTEGEVDSIGEKFDSAAGKAV